jgi:hypothetical protein
LRISILLAVLVASAGVASAGTVNISEVLYDWPSSDDGRVFVELHGPAGFDLNGYTLVGVNGYGGSITHAVDLSGFSIPADGFFVLADRTGSGRTFVANADLTDRNFDLQNGPDSVRLLFGSVVVDAVGYGRFGSSHVFAGEGSPASGVSAGSSVARRFANVDTDDNSADFVTQSGPTPGLGNLAPVAVPTPGSGALGLLGGGMLLIGAVIRRRNRGLRE